MHQKRQSYSEGYRNKNPISHVLKYNLKQKGYPLHTQLPLPIEQQNIWSGTFRFSQMHNNELHEMGANAMS